MPPFLTEEEIDQLINMQTASETSYNQKFSDLSPVNLAYHKSKNRFVNQFEEKQSDSPICMAGDITYSDDSPRFDQYIDDYDIQAEANLVEPSTVDVRDEVHCHQIESINQPRQVTYDTDEESLESLEVSEESLTFFSTSLQSIKNNIHII